MADGAKQHDEKIRARKGERGWCGVCGMGAGVHVETVEQMMQPR